MDSKLLIVDGEYVHKYTLDKIMAHSDFKEHISTDQVSLDVSFPPGTIGVKYIKTPSDESLRYAILTPKQKKNISIVDEEGIFIREMIFPQLVFDIKYNLNTEKITNSWVYMIDPRMTINNLSPGQSIPLSPLPLPNIYEDNRICHGNNESSLKNPSSMINDFYTTRFNLDLISYIGRRLPERERNEFGNIESIRNKLEYLIKLFNEPNPNRDYPQTHWLKIPRKHVNNGGNSEEWNLIVPIRR